MRFEAMTGMLHGVFQMARRERPGGARHLMRNGWHARLVPADALVDDVGAGRLDGARMRADFLARQAALDQVD